MPLSTANPRNLVVTLDNVAPLYSTLLRGGEPHLATLRDQGLALHKGAVLAFESFGDSVLCAASSTYFANVATADALRREYIELGIGPLRIRAHACAMGDPFRSGLGRAAAIGVTVAVTVPAPAGRAVLVGRRHHHHAADPDLWDVGPSGTLEPELTGDSLLMAADRELAEELPYLGANHPQSRFQSHRPKPVVSEPQASA